MSKHNGGAFADAWAQWCTNRRVHKCRIVLAAPKKRPVTKKRPASAAGLQIAYDTPRRKVKAYIREVEIDDSEENGDDCDCENLDEHEEVPEKENEKEEDNEEVPEKDNEACPENDKKEEEEKEVYTRQALSPFKKVRVCLLSDWGLCPQIADLDLDPNASSCLKICWNSQQKMLTISKEKAQ